MPYKDYYKILGVQRTASEDEIIKAFRKRAKETHPDVNLDIPKAESTKRFQEVNEAYEALSKPNLKNRYDQIYDQEQTFRREQTAPGRTTATPPPRQERQRPNPKTEQAYQSFYTDFESIFRQSSLDFNEILRQSSESFNSVFADFFKAPGFSVEQNPFVPNPKAQAGFEAEIKRRKDEDEKTRQAQLQKEKSEKTARRDKVLDTKLQITETDRLLVAALQRLYQDKNLQGLEVIDSQGRRIYEINILSSFKNRVLNIRRSLADEIDEAIMVDLPIDNSYAYRNSRFKKPREILPDQLLDAKTIEDIAQNYPDFPERYKRTANYLGDLKASAIFLLNPEADVPPLLFQDLREIDKFNRETNAPAFSFREITSGLDLSRIREIKPGAPEGQPSASRL